MPSIHWKIIEDPVQQVTPLYTGALKKYGPSLRPLEDYRRCSSSTERCVSHIHHFIKYAQLPVSIFGTIDKQILMHLIMLTLVDIKGGLIFSEGK